MAQGNIGVLFNNLRGKAGSVVFARSKDGTVVKPRISGRNPRTPAQVAARERLSDASRAYKTLTVPQVVVWKNYAATIVRHDERTARTYAPSAIAAFTELATKFLQVSPTDPVPVTPPAASFNGQPFEIEAVGSTGAVQFQAPAANSAGVVTEVLIQTLKSQNRAPQPGAYRSKNFYAFTSTVQEADVALAPGWYAPAYRYVKTATGQATELVPLPPVQVV